MPLEARRRTRLLALTLSSARLLPNRFRPVLLRRVGMVVDEHVLILGGTTVTGPGRIQIGPDSFVNHECYFDCAGDIVIGSGVAIGPRARLLTSTHEIGFPEHRAGAGLAKPVRIGDGCWLGAGVTVLPGVTVGAGAVIGAGSVVTTDTEPDGVYVGTPARRLRAIDDPHLRPNHDVTAMARRLRAGRTRSIERETTD